MNTTLAVVFSIVYLLEAGFLFFLGNSLHRVPALVIGLVVALAALWATYAFLQKSTTSHPTVILIVVALVVAIALVFAL